jgi:hypothetical protein
MSDTVGDVLVRRRVSPMGAGVLLFCPLRFSTYSWHISQFPSFVGDHSVTTAVM